MKIFIKFLQERSQESHYSLFNTGLTACYAFSVKPSKGSVWKICLYMYVCVALHVLVNKLLSYPMMVSTCFYQQSRLLYGIIYNEYENDT